MYQTYAGQVLNGKPVISEKVNLRENTKFIITFLDDLPEPETKTKSQRQLEALERFIAANKALDEQGIEPLDDEFFAIINSGTGIDSGVEL